LDRIDCYPNRHAYSRNLPSIPTRRSSDLTKSVMVCSKSIYDHAEIFDAGNCDSATIYLPMASMYRPSRDSISAQACEVSLLPTRSEEHTSELQSRENLVCRLLLEKKKRKT